MPYEIRDEENQLMRVVGRHEEAQEIVRTRDGWSFKRVVVEKLKFKFEEALI